MKKKPKTTTIRPKHFETKDDLYSDFYRCPVCKSTCISDRFAYCPMCGVKLIWKITNKENKS